MKTPNDFIQYVLNKYLEKVGAKVFDNTFYYTGTKLFDLIDEMYLAGKTREQSAMLVASLYERAKL